MSRRLPLLACLLAVVLSLVPSLALAALAAPAGLPAGGPVQPPNSGIALDRPGAEELAGILTGRPVSAAGPDGRVVSGLTVRSGVADFFTVLCRQWDATTSGSALQGSWYYSEPGSSAGAIAAGQAAGLARSLPMVGHACAVTRDPSPANIARLAFDVVTVIVFVQFAMHAVPEISGLAVAINHAPSAVAAAQILLQHGPGIIATVRAGMATIDRLNAEGDQLQARLKAGSQAQIENPQDLQESIGPALEALSKSSGPALGSSPDGQAVPAANIQALLPEALSGGRAAAGVAAKWVGENGPTLRRGLDQGFVWTGQAASSVLDGVCVKLPFGQFGCAPPLTAGAR